MKGRAAALLRAIGALVLTLALVVGVPALLVILVGNPFPSTLPTIQEIRILLTQNGQGFTNFLIGTLAVLIWFIWLQLVVALIVEIVATIGHNETRRLPTAPGIQMFAARMIAAITLATTIATAPILAPAVGALSFGDFAPVAAVASVMVDAPAMQADAHMAGFDGATGLVTSDQAHPSTISLSDHTELWDLADAAYGDGMSWKLIAQANAGLYDAGGTLITDETESVAPHTKLHLPGVEAVIDIAAFGEFNDAASYSAGADTAVADAYVVEKGDSMWSVAEESARADLERQPTDQEVSEYWAEIVAANADTPSGDIDVIYPGDELAIPAGTALLDTAQAATPSAGQPDVAEPEVTQPDIEGVVDGPSDNRDALPQTATVAEVAESQVAESHVVEPQADGASPGVASPSVASPGVASPGVASPGVASPGVIVIGSASAAADAGVYDGELPSPGEGEMAGLPVKAVGLASFGAAVLSAGIVTALRRRSDLQRRMRPSGALPPSPSTEAEAFAVALAHSADVVHSSNHGSGWRMLPVEAVAALRTVGPLEIHADESGRLHAIAVEDTGDTSVPRHLDLISTTDIADVDDITENELSGPDTVFPDDEGLSVAPTTVVAGTDTTTGAAVLIDLAASGNVELVGDDTSVQRFARSAVLDLATSDRADDMCLIAVSVADELADLERVRTASSFAEALSHAVRCGHAAPDATTPVVVIAGAPPGDDTEAAAALSELGAVVVAPGVDGRAQVVINGSRAQLLPAETTVDLAALNDDQYLAVAELIEVSSPAAMEQAATETPQPIEEVLDITETDDCMVEPGPIEVKVLGPVEVVGAEPFSSLKAIDVLAYLAFHRHGADADQIKSWVWPPYEPPSDKALANVLSRARTAMGASPDGSPYLSKAGADRTYRLSPAVTTDFDRFRLLVELANETDQPQAKLDRLKQAIELIRGVPFTGGSASSFAWADNHVRAQVEFAIDEAVHQCADLALELQDLDAARWAALKGLELTPGCEQCFQRRFLVAGAGNNRSELRRAMADLERSAAADLGEPEAVDSISQKLLELYHQLDRGLVAGAT